MNMDPNLDGRFWLERIWMSMAGAVGTSLVMFLRYWFRRTAQNQKDKLTWDNAVLAQAEKVNTHMDAIVGELRAENLNLRTQLKDAYVQTDHWQTQAMEAKIEAVKLTVLLQHLTPPPPPPPTR